MRLRFLRLLAVAIALAVPLQGFAAVAAPCLTLGQHQDGGGHGHGHDHDDLGGHDHAAHSQSDQSGSSDGQEGGKGVHCGPSTACIAGKSELPILSAPSHAPYLFSQFSPLGVQPDGLYRPPLAL
jgi:hypothetical protein